MQKKKYLEMEKYLPKMYSIYLTSLFQPAHLFGDLEYLLAYLGLERVSNYKIRCTVDSLRTQK